MRLIYCLYCLISDTILFVICVRKSGHVENRFIKGFIVVCVVDSYISLLYFICKTKCNVVVRSLIRGKLSSLLFWNQNLLTVHQKKADKNRIIFLHKTGRSLSSLHLLKLFSCILHLLSLSFFSP